MAGCYLVPGLLVRILFGISDSSVYLREMVGAMALVMGASALLNVVMQFLVAQRRFAPAFSLVFFAGVYLTGCMVSHESSWMIVWIAGLSNAGALLFGLVSVLRLKVSE